MQHVKPRGYSGLQIGLHWTVALLVAFQLFGNGPMVAAWQAWRQGQPEPAGNGQFAILHIVVGYAILVLMLWRLWLRRKRGTPPLPDSEPAPLRFLAHAVHGLIYLVLIAMPVSGSIAWFGGLGPAAGAHEIGKFVLFGLVVLHVAGALVQHFVMRTDVLARMVMAQD